MHYLFPSALLSSLSTAHAKVARLTSFPLEVRFGPLGIAAVLTNTRATSSAARLYMQPDHGNFRWPHMLQIGCALAPISMLVQKLAAESSDSAHLAVDMCLNNVDELVVTSNMDSSFPRLLVNRSNQWLKGVLSFPASPNPATDIKVVHIKTMDGTGVYSNEGTRSSPPLGVRLGKMSILILEFFMGAIVMACTLVSLLIGDTWGISLFSTYALHWLVCTLISTRRLVEPNKHLSIRPDTEIKYAVYRTPSGAIVILKAPKHILERWARTQWVFNDNDSVWAITIHWLWVLTGSAAAFTSLACMVNMCGYLQLAFLCMLGYASVAEILLTTLARALQRDHLESRDVGQTYEVIAKEKWYQSVIKISLGADEECRVSTFDWVGFGLIPKYKVFQAMLLTIEHLNQEPNSSIDDAKKWLFDITLKQDTTAVDRILKDSIWDEIKTVWTERLSSKKKGH